MRVRWERRLIALQSMRRAVQQEALPQMNLPMNAKTREHSEQAHRKRIIARLARIEGQVRGVQGMIAANQSCEAVAQQLTAARRALDKAFYDLLACNLISHVEASADIDDVRESTAELARLLTKFG